MLRREGKRVPMKSAIHFRAGPVQVAIVLAALAAGPLWAADSATQTQSVLLYSRYFNAAGEDRYLPDGTFKAVIRKLRDEFDVRVHSRPLTTETLAGVKLVLIANPSDKAMGTNPPPPHVSPADIAALTRFVEAGGGLIVMGNQE